MIQVMINNIAPRYLTKSINEFKFKNKINPNFSIPNDGFNIYFIIIFLVTSIQVL